MLSRKHIAVCNPSKTCTGYHASRLNADICYEESIHRLQNGETFKDRGIVHGILLGWKDDYPADYIFRKEHEHYSFEFGLYMWNALCGKYNSDVISICIDENEDTTFQFNYVEFFCSWFQNCEFSDQQFLNLLIDADGNLVKNTLYNSKLFRKSRPLKKAFWDKAAKVLSFQDIVAITEQYFASHKLGKQNVFYITNNGQTANHYYGISNCDDPFVFVDLMCCVSKQKTAPLSELDMQSIVQFRDVFRAHGFPYYRQTPEDMGTAFSALREMEKDLKLGIGFFFTEDDVSEFETILLRALLGRIIQ